MIRKKEKEQRSIRFPKDLFDKIEAVATEEGCSFTEAVISILQEHFSKEASLIDKYNSVFTKEKLNKMTNTPCHLCQNYGFMKMRVDDERYVYADKTCSKNHELFPDDDCVDFKRRVLHGV